MIKKLTGSYMAVMEAQGHEKSILNDFERNRGLQENRSVIKKDLPRTSLVDFTGAPFSQFAEEVDSETVYKEHYIQGNLDGGLALDIYDIFKGKKLGSFYKEADKFPHNSVQKQKIMDESQEFFQSWTTNRSCLRFAYRDEQNRLCAVGLVFNKEKPENWALQIFKNITAPLEDRTTTLFAQGEIINAAKSTDIETASLSEQIKLALGSEKTNQLLTGLINNDGVISLPLFKEVTGRLRSNTNIDNRDIKKNKLEELIQCAQLLIPTDLILHAHLEKIKQLSIDQINFYKTPAFENSLCEIYKTINNHINQLEDKTKVPALLLDNKLNFYSIKLELIASEIRTEEHSLLRQLLIEEATALRTIQQRSLAEKEPYAKIEFEDLIVKVEAKNSKINQLVIVLKAAKNKLSNDFNSIAYLNDLQKRALDDPEFFQEAHFKNKLDLITKQVDIYVAEQEKEAENDLVNHLKSLATKLEKYADSRKTIMEPFLVQGLFDKAKELRSLMSTPSTKEAKEYKWITTKSLVSNTLKKELTKKKDADIQKTKSEFPCHPEQNDKNIVQRNSIPITLGIIGLLTTISALLLISGVLAPLGLALAGGLAVQLACVAAFGGGAITVLSGFQVLENQDQYIYNQHIYAQSVSKVESKLTLINTKYEEAIKWVDSGKFNEEQVIPKQTVVQKTADNVSQQSDNTVAVVGKGHESGIHKPGIALKTVEIVEQRNKIQEESLNEDIEISSCSMQP